MLSSKPKVSVIMSVYNDEQYLSEAIDSILNQTYSKFEFIIINDGSTDSSSEILDEYKRKDSRVIVINQKNVGLTKSLNKAIKLSTGDYIARMDSDDISHRDRLQKQVDFLMANVDYALVGTNVIKIDEHGKHLEVNKTKYHHNDICDTFKNRNCIAHGSVMINKELLGDLLKYDETFLYAQDFRLWAKIAKRFKIANLKEPLYMLRLHKESLSKKKIENQSIYAGIVAYEFETNESIDNIDKEITNNQKLRAKIGNILLMNFEPIIAKNYFKQYSKLYFFSIIFRLLNFKFLKNLIKKIR